MLTKKYWANFGKMNVDEKMLEHFRKMPTEKYWQHFKKYYKQLKKLLIKKI
jgi:hypothetical protein